MFGVNISELIWHRMPVCFSWRPQTVQWKCITLHSYVFSVLIFSESVYTVTFRMIWGIRILRQDSNTTFVFEYSKIWLQPWDLFSNGKTLWTIVCCITTANCIIHHIFHHRRSILGNRRYFLPRIGLLRQTTGEIYSGLETEDFKKGWFLIRI